MEQTTELWYGASVTYGKWKHEDVCMYVAKNYNNQNRNNGNYLEATTEYIKGDCSK